MKNPVVAGAFLDDDAGSSSGSAYVFDGVIAPIEIAIDIKPGSDSNPINPFSRGVIPVAILGSDIFDVANVDVTTLAGCGHGYELALLVPPLIWMRQRRRRRNA